MRSYPVDGPEAAARIVAMTLMADGGPGKAELDLLCEHDAAGQLGLAPQRLHAALRQFCEDLLAASEHSWSHACRLDPSAMASMLMEVRDQRLREKLLQLCVAVAEADGCIQDGEASVLAAAARHWRIADSRAGDGSGTAHRHEAAATD
ncbi:MAG: TerB family tellurite resistance protein [Burkholderiaceae bacterium]|nr:TerB family tellurite resistance protein [Burkholderiaceae bacterium]